MRKLRKQMSASLLAFVMGATTVSLGLGNDVYGQTTSTLNVENITVQKEVAIIEENFPDPIFRAWLQSPNNINGYGVDGILTSDEISRITKINVASTGISSLKGIEFFTALESLSAGNNYLKELDVRNNKNLMYLNCDVNTIANLDVSGLTNLKALFCERNSMTSLNLTGCISLEIIYCRSNCLTKVDFSTNTNLKFIETFDNQLPDIDLSALTKLEFVHLDHNKMTFVDLSHNTNLSPIGSGFVVRNNYLNSFKVPVKLDLFVDPDVYAEQNPKTGYEKVEWYLDPEFTQQITEPIAANGQTFYAKWIPNKYIIHFDGNGGSGIMSPQQVEWDQTFVLQENQFERIGYLFDGWKSSRNNLSYTNKQQVSNLVSGKHNGEKMTLSAIWKPITYTISFDKNGGTGEDMPAQSVSYNQGITLANCSYTPPEGKKFAGWSTTTNDKVQFLDGSIAQNLATEDGKTVVLYAVWKDNISNDKLQELETEFKKYNANDYTMFDYGTIRNIYLGAEEQLTSSSLTDNEILNILTQAKEKMQAVPTLIKRVDTITTQWRSDYEDIKNTMNEHKVDESNAAALYEKANQAITSISPEYVKIKFPEIDNIADQEQIAFMLNEKVDPTLKALNSLIDATNWVQTLGGFSVRPYAEVTSKMYGKYKEICSNAENYHLNISLQMKENLEARQAFALDKQSMVSDMTKLYQSYDMTQYTEENQIKLKEIYDNSIINIEKSELNSEMEQIFTQCEELLQQVPVKKNDTEEGKPDAGIGEGKPDTGAGEGKPDTGAGEGKPDTGTEEGKPDAGTGEGKPDAGAGEGKPDAGTEEGKPDVGTGEGKPDAGAGEGKPDTGAGEGKPDEGTGEGKPDAGAGEGKPDTGNGVEDKPNGSATGGNTASNGGSAGGSPVVMPPVIAPPIANNNKDNTTDKKEESVEQTQENKNTPIKKEETIKKPETNIGKPLRQLQAKKDYQTKVVAGSNIVKIYFVFTGKYSGKSAITFTPSTKLASKLTTLKAGKDYTLKITEYKDRVQVKIMLKGKYKGTFVQDYKKTTLKTKNKKVGKTKLTKIVQPQNKSK